MLKLLRDYTKDSTGLVFVRKWWLIYFCNSNPFYNKKIYGEPVRKFKRETGETFWWFYVDCIELESKRKPLYRLPKTLSKKLEKDLLEGNLIEPGTYKYKDLFPRKIYYKYLPLK